MDRYPTYPETSPNSTLNCRGTLLSLDIPQVMGILNLTPDSFSDGGKYNRMDVALAHTEVMLQEGASIVDIGGYSSRPGAIDISPQEELGRITDITAAVLEKFPEAVVSVDTFRAEVAREMLALGVHIVNDISGGGADPEMYGVVADAGAPYILMHMQGRPQNMQKNPQYEDVIGDLWAYFSERLQLARAAGITDIVLDPGFGFGKSLSHNYELFRNLHKFNLLEVPILVGISRKSMIYKLFDAQPDEVLDLTTALHLKALEMGARLLRVHDVKAAVRAVQMYRYLNHGVI